MMKDSCKLKCKDRKWPWVRKKDRTNVRKNFKNVEKMIVGLKTILISIKTKSCFRKQKKSSRFVFAKHVFDICSSYCTCEELPTNRCLLAEGKLIFLFR